MQNKKGFTLIELVMVIVILGILAAVAIPRYVNLQQEALDATFKGVCGGLKSTAVILIGSSTAAHARGELKDLSEIIANTEYDTAEMGIAANGAGILRITYQSSYRDCTLGAGRLSFN